MFWVQDADGHPYEVAKLPRLQQMIDKTLRGEVKPLMLADKHQTAPRITSEPVLDTGTAPLRDSFSYMRAEYGLWATSDERQSSRRDLLQGLVQLAPEVFEYRAFLYSAAIRAGSRNDR